MQEAIPIEIVGANDWLDWFKAFGPISSSFVGIFALVLSYYMTKLQVTASAKESWLNEFRQDISEYLTTISTVHELMEAGHLRQSKIAELDQSPNPDTEQIKKYEQEEQRIHEKFLHNKEKAFLYSFKTRLFLNQIKESHNLLNELIDDLDKLSFTWEKNLKSNEYDPMLHKFIGIGMQATMDNIRKETKKVINEEIKSITSKKVYKK